MKIKQVDVRGRSCPEPVLLAKKAIADKPAAVEVIADTSVAKDNITRLAESNGYKVKVSQKGEDFILTLEL